VAEDLSHLQQFAIVRATLANWPLLVLDKLGLRSMCRYRTRSGRRIWCRGRTTDVNEAVAVLSGFEYPRALVRISDGAVVLDAGANIGSFGLLVADVNGSTSFRMVAFEPFPENFALLRRNFAENALTNIDAVEAALSSVDGPVRLVSPGSPDEVRIARDSDDVSDVEATSWRLGTFCSHAGIESVQLLKLDVEGAEYEIIGADLDFIEDRVEAMLIEYHELGPGRDAASLRRSLDDRFVVTTVHERSQTGVLHARRRRPQMRAR
jgi:FkbM family methyltransferase